MQTYELILKSEASKSFLATKAANSCDLDLSKKLQHQFKIEADLESVFNVGLILGSSGSGKTTLAKHIYGEDKFKTLLDENKVLIDQFPENLNYDEISSILCAIGLSQVPCWVRPAKTLSNGQKFRAEVALQVAHKKELILIDEWTSVVDRTVAKAMSHTVQKFARKNGTKLVLLSCHYDVIDWLLPDWIVDCNTQKFENRRLLRQQRTEKLYFEIREVDKSTWRNFSKYHYLSDKIPGGICFFFGLFHNDQQIGFQCFANYTPRVAGQKIILHFNRTVIHPDFCGFGLGIKLINETSRIMIKKGFKVMGKFSSISVYKSMIKSNSWKLQKIDRKTNYKSKARKSGFRIDQRVFSFLFTEKSK